MTFRARPPASAPPDDAQAAAVTVAAKTIETAVRVPISIPPNPFHKEIAVAERTAAKWPYPGTPGAHNQDPILERLRCLIRPLQFPCGSNATRRNQESTYTRWTDMRKPRAALPAVVAASFLASSCYSVRVQPVPAPEVRDSTNIRGVVLGEGPDSETFEFSGVEHVRWTEAALIVTGVVRAPGENGDGGTETISFPLSDVSEVLVRELDGTRISVIVASVLVGTAAVIAFAVTGKTKEGGPIGRIR